jgi:hypothetical protein
MKKIYYWWNNEARYYHRDFIQGVRNLIRWFPIIYNDQDWDDHFIWEIWKFKLYNQAKYIGGKDRHVDAKRDAEIILLCTRLMDRIQDEYYQAEYQDYQETKFRFEDSEHCHDCNELFIDEISEHFDDYFKKYPLIYKRVINGEGIFRREGREDNKQIIAMNIAHINNDRVKKLLFTLLERNILKWWD